MIEWNEEIQKQYRTSLILSAVLLIKVPIIYLIVAHLIDVKEISNGGETELMFYILLVFSILQPGILPLIERYQINIFSKNPDSKAVNLNTESFPEMTLPKKGTKYGLYQTVSIIKAAFVEAIYIYGLVVYLISGDIMNMYYFYPIGIIWTMLYFPTKSRCKAFLEKVERYET